MTVAKTTNPGVYQVMVEGVAEQFTGINKVSKYLNDLGVLGDTKLRKPDIMEGLYAGNDGAFAIVFVPEGEATLEVPDSDEVEVAVTEPVAEESVDEDVADQGTDDEDATDDSQGDDEGDDNSDGAPQDDAPQAPVLSQYELLMAQIKRQGPPAKKPKQALAGTAVEYPEVGHFADEKALKKFYRQLSDTQLDEWIELEGLEWKSCDNESINRMRRCMAIKDKHFPPATGSTSKKSKYAKYTDEALLELAIKHSVEVKVPKVPSKPIQRMYAIQALRDAGIIS